MWDMGLKQCIECGISFPRTEDYFYPSNSHSDGLMPYCIECDIERSKKWYEENRERAQAYGRRYYRINRVRILEHYRKMGQIYRRKYYARPEVREKMRAANREWQRRNPEKNRINSRRYLARKHHAEGQHTVDDVQEIYAQQEGRCAYCGIPVHENYHVDHMVPLSRGGSDWPENLVIACPECNISKHAKTVDEWLIYRGW